MTTPASRQLLQLDEHASALVDAARADRSATPDGDPRAALLDRIEATAHELRDVVSAPVRIGVVGEVSAGKSLLLGSLLGHGGLLPVDATPTTGNITSMRLVQATDDTSTHITRRVVSFMDRASLLACLEWMRSEALVRARSARLPAALCRQLQQLDLTDPEPWRALDGWAAAAWDVSDDTSLRLIIRELVLLVRSWQRLNALAGVEAAIDPALAETATRLDDPPDGIARMALDEVLAPAIAALQGAGKPKPGAALSPALVRAAFPIIRRLEYDVAVASSVWDLSALSSTNPLALVDFAGLGSGNARDLFLCLRELHDMHTILVVFDARSANREVAMSFLERLKEQRDGAELDDAILVAAGHIDALELHPEGGREKLRDLLRDGSHVTERRVCGAIKPLNNVVTLSKWLTSHADRVTLVSPVLALDELGRQRPELDVGSAAHRESWRESVERAQPTLELLADLGDRLRTSAPNSALGRWLGALTEDDAHGGVEALRATIVRHVAAHGLEQVLQAARRTERRLDDEVDRLRRLHRRTIPPELEARSARWRRALEQLRALYRARTLPSGHELTLTDLPPSCQVRSALLHDRGDGDAGWRVRDVIEAELIHRVRQWPCWQLLLEQAHDGFLVPRVDDVRSASFERQRKRRRPNGADRANIPLVTDDFHAPFSAVFDAMGELVTRCIHDAAGTYLATTARDSDSFAGGLDGHTELAHANDSEHLSLTDAVNPDNDAIRDDLARAIAAPRADDAGAVEAVFAVYPFVTSSTHSVHNRRQAVAKSLGWDARRQAPEVRNELNHQFHVLRLQSRIIETLRGHFLQQMRDAQDRLSTELNLYFADLTEMLGEEIARLDRDDVAFRDVSPGTDSTADDSTEDGLRVLTLRSTGHSHP